MQRTASRYTVHDYVYVLACCAIIISISLQLLASQSSSFFVALTLSKLTECNMYIILCWDCA